MDSPYPAIPLVHLPPMCLPSLGKPTKRGSWDFQQAMAEAHAPPGQRVPIYTLVQSFLC